MQDAELTVAKRARRAELRGVRRAIVSDSADRLARSARIWARILAIAELDGRLSRRVMLFDGLATEPATEAWFDWCATHGVEAFVPAVDGLDLRVEPGDLDPACLDVVVVPGLGFTTDGRRLGQGGGHYDRFLPRLASTCITIGACFAEQVVADLPVEPHDQRVDHVATDAEDPR